MSKIAAKILAAREQKVEAGGWTFTVRRPSAMQTAEWIGVPGRELTQKILHECVVGWTLLEQDVIPGGGDQPVPFEREDFIAWVEDQPVVWEPITSAVMKAVTDWTERVEAGRKN